MCGCRFYGRYILSTCMCMCSLMECILLWWQYLHQQWACAQCFRMHMQLSYSNALWLCQMALYIRIPCMGMQLLNACVSWLSYNAVEEFLEQFWIPFSENMDAKAVVAEFQHRGIIGSGELDRVLSIHGERQQNQYLHLCLKKTCTEDALKEVCVIISKVEGNPRMKTLGEAMKAKLQLETGKCTLVVHESLYMCMLVCTGVCVCMCGNNETTLIILWKRLHGHYLHRHTT